MIDLRTRQHPVNIDKRVYPRLEFHCPVVIRRFKGVKRVTDLSMGGLFIELNSMQKELLNIILDLTIKFPTSHETIRVKAKVVNINKRGIGCKFVKLTKQDQEAVKTCFEAFQDTIPIK